MSQDHSIGLDLDWIRGTGLDDDQVAERATRYSFSADGEPSTPAEKQALIKAVSCLDLTDLDVDGADGRIAALCAAARAPFAGIPTRDPEPETTVAAVCVFPAAVTRAGAELADSAIPVAAACGFPDGEVAAKRLVEEIRLASIDGAREIDAVVDRNLIVGERWGELYDRVRVLREASTGLCLKIILRTGMLETSTNVARASLASAMAGADFIKTSTGMDPINATLEAGIAMAAAIRAYRVRTGFLVGLKPAGGLRSASDALGWMRLGREELGPEWNDPGLFRLGASSLLAALRSRLIELEDS